MEKENNEMSLPFDAMIDAAESVCTSALEQEQQGRSRQVEMLADELLFRWQMILDLYASLLLGTYFSRDYKDAQLDSRALRYLIEPIFASNELLDLCASIQSFYSGKVEFPADRVLLDVDFESFKLVSEERTGRALKPFLARMQELVAAFKKQVYGEVLVNAHVQLDQHPMIMYAGSQKQRKMQVSRVYLKMPNAGALDLFPLVLHVTDETCEQRWLSLDAADWRTATEVRYRDFQCRSEEVCLNDARIIQQVFAFKNKVAEAPEYHDTVVLEGSNIRVEFYGGNIFDLNRVAREVTKNGGKAALVLVPDAHPVNKTAICRQYEKLSGRQTDHLLPKDLELARVYPVYPSQDKSNKLTFDSLLFVPLFDMNDGQPPEEQVTRQAIDNLLDYLSRQPGVHKMTLIVPGLGSYRGEQLTRAVAAYWAERLGQCTQDSAVPCHIIFALLGETTIQNYTEAFFGATNRSRLENEIIQLECRRTELESDLKEKEQLLQEEKERSLSYDSFQDYTYPLIRLYQQMRGVDRLHKKRESMLNAVECVYSFLVAVALSELSDKTSEEVECMIPGKYKAAQELVGLIANIWQHGSTKMTTGKWREWACRACICSDWIQQMLETISCGHDRQLVNAFLGLPNTCKEPFDFVKLRNRNAHPEDCCPDCDLDAAALDAHVEYLRRLMQSMPFMGAAFQELVWVDVYKPNRRRLTTTITWRSLTGPTNIFLPETKTFPLHAPFDRLDPDQAFLWRHRGKPDSMILPMDPFIRYVLCDSCKYRRVYIWSGCEKGRLLYQSIGCSCKPTEHVLAALYDDGAEMFASLFEELYAKFRNPEEE